MSTPEKMPFATTHDSCAVHLSVLTGQLLAGHGELTRLNLGTCRSVFSGAALHWKSVMQAQTPEQLVTRQVSTLPWLAVQIGGYTRGWMDNASEMTANLRQSTRDRHDEHARQVSTMLDGMAECAKGVGAMMRAVNPAYSAVESAPVARPHADSRDVARAVLVRTAEAAPAAAKRRSTSPARRQSSR